ncbi:MULTISPECIES: Smr/MutS family protein [unclassified Roseitalea]|uniref:Smr/MutS family protein n=1 Tax=unclassified Roseitalea TaxID=2639107 RepID=UPI00273E891E|nr:MULTISPECIES: Smr/MutS family protein [unclassified Roseitalea]
MSKRRADHKPNHPLSLEDRILWNRVARTVNPLDRARHRAAQQEVWAEWVAEAFDDQPPTDRPVSRPSGETRRAALPRTGAAPARPEPRPGHRPSGPGPLEQPVYRKLARGRMPIDASIDLHHLTQDEAHTHLHRFLVQARARDCRHVLVVTGKGRSPHSEGVLRRMLPIWLAAEPFASLVSGVRQAARGHGGEGAFYVRLRRPGDHRRSARR